MTSNILHDKYPQGLYVHLNISDNHNDPANQRVYMVNWRLVGEQGKWQLRTPKVPISLNCNHVQFVHPRELLIPENQEHAKEIYSSGNVTVY